MKRFSHARIQEYSSGGGDPVFLVFNLFKEVQWLLSKKTATSQGSRGGPSFSRGGGVQLLIPYRNPINMRFSRGRVRAPCPPSGSAHVSSGKKKLHQLQQQKQYLKLKL